MCIVLHQTGSVGEGSDHLQLIKFWPSRAPVKEVCGWAKIFGSALLQPARSVWGCVSLRAFFILFATLSCISFTFLFSQALRGRATKFADRTVVHKLFFRQGRLKEFSKPSSHTSVKIRFIPQFYTKLDIALKHTEKQLYRSNLSS